MAVRLKLTKLPKVSVPTEPAHQPADRATALPVELPWGFKAGSWGETVCPPLGDQPEEVP